MEFTIRPFEPRDQNQARHVVLAGLGEHFGFINESLNPDLENIQQSFIAAGHDFFVAESDNGIVGTVGVLYEAGQPRIVRMSVGKHVRRNGIARALLQHAIHRARIRGCSEIIAFTEPHWSDAVGFYKSCGFREYGRDEVDLHLRLKLAE